MTRTEPGWVCRETLQIPESKRISHPTRLKFLIQFNFPNPSFFQLCGWTSLLVSCFYRILHNRNLVRGRPEANQKEIMSVYLPFYHINHSCTYHIPLRTAQLIIGRQMLTGNDNECQTTRNVRFWPEEKLMWFTNLIWSQKVGEHFLPPSHPCGAQWFYRDLQTPVNLCNLVGGNLSLSDFVNILILSMKNSTRESN